MDRIAALRNVEDALSAFEAGDVDLATLERRVVGVLRTYASNLDRAGLAAYRASGSPAVEGVVVVAESPAAARERVGALVDVDGAFEIERLD